MWCLILLSLGLFASLTHVVVNLAECLHIFPDGGFGMSHLNQHMLSRSTIDLQLISCKILPVKFLILLQVDQAIRQKCKWLALAQNLLTTNSRLSGNPEILHKARE
jgi:hypothetical protein